MIYGNYINESCDRFYVLEQDTNILIQNIEEEYNQFNNMISLNEGIDFVAILNKISDSIIELIKKIRNYIEISIDKLNSLYAELLRRINKDSRIKYNVKISDYSKIQETDKSLQTVIDKADDCERKLQMNKNDEDFLDQVEMTSDEIKDTHFNYDIINIDKTYLTAQRYYNAGEVIGSIKKVFDICIASKKNVLDRLPHIETMAKNAKKTLRKDNNDNNTKGNKVSVHFFNSVLTFLNKALKMYRAMDARLIKDIKLVHKNSHENIISAVSNYLKLYDSFKNISGKFPKNVRMSKPIKTQEDYTELTKCHKIIYQTENYEEYKEAFNKIAAFFKLPPKEIIIQNLEFISAKDADKFGMIKIRYARGLAKVSLPKHTHLIHSSPAKLPGYVEGAFRSRVNGKYYYPEKRIFFTVERVVDANKNGTEGITMDVYVTVDSYSSAYLDPSCPTFSDRCVMLMTDDKVPVRKVTNVDLAKQQHKEREAKTNELENNKKELEKDTSNLSDTSNNTDNTENTTSTEESTIEGNFFLDKLNEMMTEYESLDEAVDNNVKELIRDINKWSTANSKQRIKQFYNNKLDEDEYFMLKECIKTIKEAKSYEKYYPAFSKLCRFCSILPEHVILSKYQLKNEGADIFSIYIEYSHNNKKITLPEGTKLFHISKIPNIRTLKPFFKGKSEKGYIYDKPRIYFTIHKNMPRFLADYKMTDKLYKYQAKQDIREVYVDPLVWLYTQGAVYIESKNEVPVELVKQEGFNIF